MEVKIKFDIKLLEKIYLLLLLFLCTYFSYLAYNMTCNGDDEGIYLQIANNFPKFPKYYEGLIPYSQPFFISYFIIGPLFKIFGFSLGLAKIIIVLIGFTTLFLIYLIGKRINIIAGMVASSIPLAITIFGRYIFSVYMEVPSAFCSVFFLYLLLNLKNKKNAIIIGVVLGFSYFIKQSVIILIGIVGVMFLYNIYKKQYEIAKLFIIIGVVCSIIIGIWGLRNIIVYNYPFVEVANFFFPKPSEFAWKDVTRANWTEDKINIKEFNLYALFLGIISIILSIVTVNVNDIKISTKSKEMTLCLIIIGIFIAIYLVRTFVSYTVWSSGIYPRHFIFIVPQFCIAIGILFGKLYEIKKVKIFILIISIAIICFFMYFAIRNANDVKDISWQPPLMNAFEWIKYNTPENAVIFTPNCGPTYVIARRNCMWMGMEEFDKIMNTTNGTYIYDVLKKYNVTHIMPVIWYTAEEWTYPGQNTDGSFTFKFVNATISSQKFKLVYNDILYNTLFIIKLEDE